MPAKSCSLCSDDQVLNGQQEVGVGSAMTTCEEIDSEGSNLSTQSTNDYLSPCAQYQRDYAEECCMKSSEGDGADHGEASDNPDNLFVVRTTPEDMEEELSMSEGINTFSFGVRRENTWSDAATSRPIGRLSLLVSALALARAYAL